MIWQEKILKCPFHRYAINKIPIYPNYIINSSQSQTSIGPKIIPDNKFIISNHSLNDRIEGQNIYKINIPYNSNNSSFLKSNRKIKINTDIINNINYTRNNNYKKISLSDANINKINNPIRILGSNSFRNYNLRLKNNENNKTFEISNFYKYKNSREKNKDNYSTFTRNELSEDEISRHKIKSQRINKDLKYNLRNDNLINNKTKKESKSSYRRRNEINIDKKNMTPDRFYNRSGRNFSYNIENQSGNFNLENKKLKINPVSYVVLPRKYNNMTNNEIKHYSSKTQDLSNRRISTEPKEINNIKYRNDTMYKNRNQNSVVVKATDSINHEFYISRDYNNYNYNNKIIYKTLTQPILKEPEEFDDNNYLITDFPYSQRNPYKKILKINYNNSGNNNGTLYEIDKYDDNNIIKYDKSCPLLRCDNQEKIKNQKQFIKHKKIKIIRKNNNNLDLSKDYLKYKKKHKIQKLKNIIIVKKEKKNEKEKNDDIIEDNIEKYFDKNGNCIGGRKIIIKKEYSNGQKIIEKFVQEKYKQNSEYEKLKEKAEYNYNQKIENDKKDNNNNNIIEENQEDEKGNTCVTFGIKSKASKFEDEIDNFDEKEADEQKIEVNSEFNEEMEINDDKDKKLDNNKNINNNNINDNKKELEEIKEEEEKNIILEKKIIENGINQNDINNEK